MTQPSSRSQSGAPEGSEPSLDRQVALDALVSNTPEYMCVLTPSGSVLFSSHPSVEVFIGTEQTVVRDAIDRVGRTGEEEEQAFQAPHEGRARFYHARVKRAAIREVPHVLLFIRDMTQQHEAEATLKATVRELEESRRQMIQAQKMQSIGRLAGGVAHDFNNLLTAIISFTRFVMDDLGTNDPRRADLAEVLKAADSAAKLTRQLLAFSRNQATEPVLTELNSAISRFGGVLRRTLEESIHLRVVEAGVPVHAMCDPGQLDQLIMNLAVNARDAMPQGGALSIEVGRRTVEHHSQLVPGEYAMLCVSDTGCGMTPDVLSSIFEPFFTTKGEFGTGLGLATCYGITKQARGHIDVESHPGLGSRFTILLPLVQQAPLQTSAPPVLVASRPTSDSVALVVEDQVSIRRSMMRSLQKAGFNVIDARSAEEALALLNEQKTRVDLLVTDIVLPGIDGIRLAQRLRAEQPELRVLICSGYAGTAACEDIEGQPYTSFLPKPFTGSDLISRATALFSPTVSTFRP
jgi:signal transduction histidine kinase/CheY-like chemotaxis protein